MSEVSKKLNLQGHTTGEDCICKQLKCFKIVPEYARTKIIQDFNLMSSVDEQNSHLSGLISVQEVQTRRPRLAEADASFWEASYSCRVRFIDDDIKIKEVQVCRQAFLALHGIGKKKVEGIQRSLKATGKAPKYKRGKHSSLHRKMPDDKRSAVIEHIILQRKKGPLQYNLAESSKINLPEDLNITKCIVRTKKWTRICKYLINRTDL